MLIYYYQKLHKQRSITYGIIIKQPRTTLVTLSYNHRDLWLQTSSVYYCVVDSMVIWRSRLDLEMDWQLGVSDRIWRCNFYFWRLRFYSASTVIANGKSSISTYMKSTTRFPTSHRWTVYVTPKSPKGWHKNAISLFEPVKFNFYRKKVCYKVSLYENFQRQSCSYIIPVSNGP